MKDFLLSGRCDAPRVSRPLYLSQSLLPTLLYSTATMLALATPVGRKACLSIICIFTAVTFISGFLSWHRFFLLLLRGLIGQNHQLYNSAANLYTVYTFVTTGVKDHDYENTFSCCFCSILCCIYILWHYCNVDIHTYSGTSDKGPSEKRTAIIHNYHFP